MPKKSKKEKQDELTDHESTEANAEWTESTAGERDAESPASDSQGEPAEAAQASESADEDAMDDLLADVRRSLIEDEAAHDEKKTGWWDRLSKSGHKEQEAKAVEPKVEHSLVLPEPVHTSPEKEDEYLEQIDELIDLLDNEDEKPEASTLMPATVDAPKEPTPAEVAPEPAPDLNELKKRVFNVRPEDRPEEPLNEVRTIALEGGEEVFVEVEAAKVDPAKERVQAFENAVRPYRSYIYFTTAILGVLMAIAVIFLMLRTLAANGQLAFLMPEAAATADPNLPYPISLALPGGVNFNLAQGAIKNGKWNPSKPEWLVGTEVCRWVAIPWSLQLEAVVRTFTRADVIELGMSNNDKIAYNVYSIQELTLEEMQALSQNQPCLLLVLARSDSDKRWVVTALP